MACKLKIAGHFYGAPGERTFYRVKVPRPPGSGKVIAKAKGVRREVESEGRRRQSSGPTNRNHVRPQVRARLLYKPKPKLHGIACGKHDGYRILSMKKTKPVYREKNGLPS